MRILVTSETHFLRGPDGRTYSTTGVDGASFWRRYLDIFDEVLVAARTRAASRVDGLLPVEAPGVRVVPLPSYRGPWAYLRVRRRLADAMRAALREADVICGRAPGPIAAWAWRLRESRPFGVEVVGDPRDALARGTVRSVLRPVARVLLARQLRRLCRSATAVAYVTEQALQERYATSAWSTSYSSIDLSDEAFITEDAVVRRFSHECRRMKGSVDAPWRLVFVGSLAQLYKGEDVLIDALALARRRNLEVTLTVVGDGRQRRLLERRARRRGVEAYVQFTGTLAAGSVVRAMLDSSDIFVLPSRTEGLPRAMIEAMARGIPCLGSAVGGIPELLPRERLVRPGDARDLSDAIIRLCSNPADLLSCALRDLSLAERYHLRQLQPKRREFYRRLREAAVRSVDRTRAYEPAERRAGEDLPVLGAGDATRPVLAAT
jgi:glycosyltransferase involved in cell wall biosynthesis